MKCKIVVGGDEGQTHRGQITWGLRSLGQAVAVFSSCFGKQGGMTGSDLGPWGRNSGSPAGRRCSILEMMVSWTKVLVAPASTKSGSRYNWWWYQLYMDVYIKFVFPPCPNEEALPSSRLPSCHLQSRVAICLSAFTRSVHIVALFLARFAGSYSFWSCLFVYEWGFCESGLSLVCFLWHQMADWTVS